MEFQDQPVISVAVEPRTHADQKDGVQTLSDEEDPTFSSEEVTKKLDKQCRLG